MERFMDGSWVVVTFQHQIQEGAQSDTAAVNSLQRFTFPFPFVRRTPSVS